MCAHQDVSMGVHLQQVSIEGVENQASEKTGNKGLVTALIGSKTRGWRKVSGPYKTITPFLLSIIHNFKTLVHNTKVNYKKLSGEDKCFGQCINDSISVSEI